jgi:hypothetical protein
VHSFVRGASLAILTTFVLTGCNSGDSSDPKSGSREGSSSSGSPSTANAINRTPDVTGTPATSVLAGSDYAYQPQVQDGDGDALSFSVTGKPSWAVFDITTGRLSGTPALADVGRYEGIVISVNDGSITIAQPAFAIDVLDAADASTTEISWRAPTENADASPISDLGGYRVYHGDSPDTLTEVHDLPATAYNYVFRALSAGTHFFAISTYNLSGVESALSAIVSKTIP